MTRTTWILVAVAALATSACATLMQGSSQEVGISSTPSEAAVTVNNEERGHTPLALDLKRKNQHTIEIALAGYEPYEITLTKSTSGWVWGNIVFGGIIGLAVDAITGGLYVLNPEQVEAELRRADRESVRVRADDEGVYVFVTLEPRVEWERVGARALERAW